MQKRYAFELEDIPTTLTDYYQVQFSFKHKGHIPVRIHNSYFTYALQSTQTIIEQFLVFKSIRGPCWLQLEQYDINVKLKDFRVCTPYYIQCSQVGLHARAYVDAPPPLKVLSMSCKNVINQRQEEIISISLQLVDKVSQDGGNSDQQKSLFKTFIRMPQNARWPVDYQPSKEQKVDNETQLITQVLSKIDQYDPDIILAHDLYSGCMSMLIKRITRLKITTFNRLARIQRVGAAIPKVKGNELVRVMTAGRLLVDTYQSARELLKSSSYSLKHLASIYLQQEIHEVESDVMQDYMESGQLISLLVNIAEKDCAAQFELMEKLQVIPLTKQLTNTAGNLWIRSLQNARAERNEMLLMHEFHKKNFILPDRLVQ